MLLHGRVSGDTFQTRLTADEKISVEYDGASRCRVVPVLRHPRNADNGARSWRSASQPEHHTKGKVGSDGLALGYVEDPRASRRGLAQAGRGGPRKAGAGASAVPAAAIRTAAAAASDGDSYTLRSALLANDPTLRQIAETSLVLVEPEHPKLVAGIEAIQEALNRLAIAGVALPRIRFGAMDKFRGWFGPQTVDALRAFQRFAGIGVDAKIGDDTLRALDNALVSAGVGGPMATKPARQPLAAREPLAASQPAVGAPTPAGKFVKTLVKVFSRGIPPLGFLQELVAWGKMAPDEIFVDQPGNEKDVYASVITELGPFEDITHRRACMLEVMRVLAGFESSWKWNTGLDTTNLAEDTPDRFLKLARVK